MNEVLQGVPLGEVDRQLAAQQTTVGWRHERQPGQLLDERGDDAFGHVGGVERHVEKVEESGKYFKLKLLDDFVYFLAS